MKISVALCTYNGEKYIQEQINSILNQSRSIDEIVISDDNSIDTTVEIAERILRETQIEYRIIRNKEAKGVSDNFLSCLKETTGDYCFTCDQDDIWNENKVERFVSYIENTNKDLYFSDGVLVDASGKSIGSNLWSAYRIKYSEIMQQGMVNSLIKKPLVTGAAMIISRQLIEKVTFIPEGVLHDEWFSMVASLSDSTEPINESTFLYRQHEKNVVGVKRVSLLQRIKVWTNVLKPQEIRRFRNLQYKRQVIFIEAARGTRYELEISKAVEFWKALIDMYKHNKICRLFLVTKFFVKGWYKKYNTGAKGFLRDAISVFYN